MRKQNIISSLERPSHPRPLMLLQTFMWFQLWAVMGGAAMNNLGDVFLVNTHFCQVSQQEWNYQIMGCIQQSSSRNCQTDFQSNRNIWRAYQQFYRKNQSLCSFYYFWGLIPLHYTYVYFLNKTLTPLYCTYTVSTLSLLTFL